MVRKGILTPFHRLKGFERRLKESGSSQSSNFHGEEDLNYDFALASVDRTAQSLAEAAKARPTTKLLDPEAVPKLDAPTRPFHRLNKPFKIPRSLNEKEWNKNSKRKTRRPLPDKKWRKLISTEENRLEGNSMFCFLCVYIIKQLCGASTRANMYLLYHIC